jgi:hypothetical protein
MISLSDAQLAIVVRWASLLPQEKRADYLVRVAAHLQIPCGRYSDGDVAAAAEQALNSLIQHHHMAA